MGIPDQQHQTSNESRLAHDPFAPPSPWMGRWASPDGICAYAPYRKYSAQSLQELRDHYDGAIAYIDDQIGALLRELQFRRILDRTIVVITADHGEEFGEHGPTLVRHGWGGSSGDHTRTRGSARERRQPTLLR
jgi:membrane-anchored protein YejM (alkaline phosphatase superfamily)